MKENSVEIDNFLIAIGGPTGIGKTSTSIDIASYFDSQIISTDSRQMYQEMEIGTGKPHPFQLNSVKHHFIDNISIHNSYSIGQYEVECLQILHDIYQVKKIAVMTGGSGLYFKAILEGLDSFPEVPEPVKNKYIDIYYTKGLVYLQELLHKKDPLYYSQVDINNPHRLIRAISVIDVSGKPFSNFLGKSKTQRNFNAIRIVLSMAREELYERINKRVLEMIEEGLVKEVETLYPFRSLPSLNTVGYKELFSYLDGDITLDQAISLIQRNSRRYAKRQMTWFSNQGEWQPFHPEQIEEMIEYIEMRIKRPF